MGAKIMNDIHIIRLRGGWRKLEPGATGMVTLPFGSLEIAEGCEKLSLFRAFQRPVSVERKLIVHLCWQKATGIKFLSVNPDVRIVNPKPDGRIILSEAESKYLLTIEIDSAQVKESFPWGEFWIEVAEAE